MAAVGAGTVKRRSRIFSRNCCTTTCEMLSVRVQSRYAGSDVDQEEGDVEGQWEERARRCEVGGKKWPKVSSVVKPHCEEASSGGKLADLIVQ